jgi:hypothetical protein
MASEESAFAETIANPFSVSYPDRSASPPYY